MSRNRDCTRLERLSFTVTFGASVGWCVALTSGCGLDSTVLLPTTENTAMGGAGSPGVGGAASSVEVRPSPFCELKWGRSWGGTSQEVLSTGKQAYPVGLGMMAIWIGYEKDDTVNNAIRNLLNALSPGGDTSLQGLVPVFYGYFIPFQAMNKDGIDKNCNENATTPNICTDGAVWIVNNRDFLREKYASYAKQVADIWGTTRPLIWLFEPGFNDYLRDSQTEPLSLDYLSIVASDLIGTIKAHLPNAIISHYASPLVTDFNEYFGAFDLSLVDLVNVTGSAQYDYFFSPTSTINPQATYRRLHEITGRPIFVDTGFVASKVSTDPGWLTVSADVMNQRIADGVMGVQMDDNVDTMQTRIDTISSQLDALNCSE